MSKLIPNKYTPSQTGTLPYLAGAVLGYDARLNLFRTQELQQTFYSMPSLTGDGEYFFTLGDIVSFITGWLLWKLGTGKISQFGLGWMVATTIAEIIEIVQGQQFFNLGILTQLRQIGG